MIHIIDKLVLTKDGLFAKGTKQEIHLQQGSLDGACAVYSLMMCLIIIRKIKRRDVTDLDFSLSIDGRTSKGRLTRLFLDNQGLVRKGYFLNRLERDLLFSFRSKVETHYKQTSNNDYETLVEFLDNNNPVELGFDRINRGGGHAVVAIGYEEFDNAVNIFCLDPGYPLFKGQIWNNILQIDINSKSKYNCINFQERSYICINEMLVISSK